MVTYPTLELSETATPLRLCPLTERRPLVCRERTAAVPRGSEDQRSDASLLGALSDGRASVSLDVGAGPAPLTKEKERWPARLCTSKSPPMTPRPRANSGDRSSAGSSPPTRDRPSTSWRD